MKRQIDVLASMLIKGWTSTADCQMAGITCPHKRREEMEREFGYWTVNSLGQGGFAFRVNKKKYHLEQRDRTVKTRWDRPAKIREFRLLRVRG